MAKLDIQYDLLNYTPASASPVDANFDRIEQYANQELIERDGTVAMRAQLKLVGDPVAELDAAPKQYVDAVLPVGIIMMFGGAAAPPGGRWAICNGAEVETAVYPELYAVIGSAYGAPAAGRFNLPDLTDRFPRGAAPGVKGGAADAPVVNHTHNIAHGHPRGTSYNQNSFHYHDGVDHLHRVDIWSGGANARHSHAGVNFDTIQFTPNPGFYLSTTNPNPLLGAGVINAANFYVGSDGPDHAHAINGVSGAADRNLNTSQERGWHAHEFDVPVQNQDSANANGGVAATNANLPPYIGVTYIVRVR